MTAVVHLRYEVLRMVRNRRTLAFSVALPLVLYYAIASAQRHAHTDGGISFPLYFMCGMAAYGALFAVFSPGGRIAVDRARGWTRQLRITPLSTGAYFRAKVLTAYAMAALTIASLYIAGAMLGVSLAANLWLEMTGLILIGLLPFAALGIALGHMLNVDSIGPAMGGLTALLAFVGGTWFPLTHGFLHDVGQYLPSYWLARAGHVGTGGAPWGLAGWLVMAGWTAILAALAAWAYRRDTNRV
jgi:ABC-2 type transport system permease protein